MLTHSFIQNNANEGPMFVPQNIVTEDDFVNYLRSTFPLFTDDDIAKVLLHYPSTNASVDMNAPKFETLGSTGPTALNQSSFGTGQQQRADVRQPPLLRQAGLAPQGSLLRARLLTIGTNPFLNSELVRRTDLRLPLVLACRSLFRQ